MIFISNLDKSNFILFKSLYSTPLIKMFWPLKAYVYKVLGILEPCNTAMTTQRYTQLSSAHSSCFAHHCAASLVHVLGTTAIVVFTTQHCCGLQGSRAERCAWHTGCAQLTFAATIITILKVTARQSTGY